MSLMCFYNARIQFWSSTTQAVHLEVVCLYRLRLVVNCLSQTGHFFCCMVSPYIATAFFSLCTSSRLFSSEGTEGTWGGVDVQALLDIPFPTPFPFPPEEKT